MPPWVEFVFLAAAAIVAAIVGSIVGARRGLKAAEDAADKETTKLVAALSERVRLLETANAEKDGTIAQQNTTIATLTTRVATLERDLEMERRITARLGAVTP